MKKTFLCVFALVCIFSGFVSEILAQQEVADARKRPLCERFAARLTPPPLYHCRYADEQPVIDGNLNDVVWQKATLIDDFKDIRGAGFPELTQGVEARMLWDKNFLYVAVKLEETDVRAKIFKRDDIVWHDNDFEVFIDPDGDGVNYFEIEVNALGTVLDLLMNHPYRSGGNFFSTWDCPGLQWAVEVCGTLNDSTDQDSFWTVEMAIPHKALSVSFNDGLQQGRLWRMNFSRVQWPRGAKNEENWVWAPTGVVDIHMPERWAYVWLTGEPSQSRRSHDASLQYDMEVYRFLWMLFYAQQEHWSEHRCYMNRIEDFGLMSADSAMIFKPNLLSVASSLPTTETKISADATPNSFELGVKRGTLWYLLDRRGHFRIISE